MGASFTREAIAPNLGIAPDKLRFAVVHEDALYGTTVGTAVATSYIPGLLLFWKQARELDFGVKAVIGTVAGYSLTDFAKATGDDVNGVLNIDFPQYDVNENFAKGLRRTRSSTRIPSRSPRGRATPRPTTRWPICSCRGSHPGPSKFWALGSEFWVPGTQNCLLKEQI